MQCVQKTLCSIGHRPTTGTCVHNLLAPSWTTTALRVSVSNCLTLEQIHQAHSHHAARGLLTSVRLLPLESMVPEYHLKKIIVNYTRASCAFHSMCVVIVHACAAEYDKAKAFGHQGFLSTCVDLTSCFYECKVTTIYSFSALESHHSIS